MVVHIIPTIDGGVLWWYETNGVVSHDGVLYFMSDTFDDCRKTLMHVVGKNLKGRVVLWGPAPAWPQMDPSWPTRDYCIMFVHREGLDHNTCFFFKERAVLTPHPPKFVDEINPKFRRLQRWFRSTGGRLRKLKQAKLLAFCMAAHPRLGFFSPAFDLVEDSLQIVARLAL